MGGTAPGGTTVNLYTDSLCTTSVARGSAGTFNGAGIAAPVPDDSTTTFYATATDGEGNRSACSFDSVTYREDSTAPQTTITSGPGNTSDSRARFTFSSNEPNSRARCRFDDGAFQNCTSPVVSERLSEGEHTFSVKVIDAAGNMDPTPATRTFTVDSTPPETTVTSGPGRQTNDANVTFAFRSNESGATFRCKLDDGAFERCSSPKTYSSLSPGRHTFQVSAVDTAGNVDESPAVRSFIVDRTAPTTTITDGPPPNSSSQSRRARFEFSSNDENATFRCKLDKGAYEVCTSPKTYGSLPDGSHTFSVKAVDVAGNEDATPATRTFFVDNAEPKTTIDSGPPAATNDRSPTFTFSSNESRGVTFRCTLEGPGADRGPEPCASPKTYENLPDGPYTFTVHATDAAGNEDTSPAMRTFRVDRVAPGTEITGGPEDGDVVRAESVTFRFKSGDPADSFECSIDGGGFSACTSPKTYRSLDDGPHTFRVRAVDPAGNRDASPEMRSFTFRRTAPAAEPPETRITAGPEGRTNSSTATFRFRSPDPDVGFRCKLDDGPYTNCTSPKTYEDLAEGPHRFVVRAIDSSGNFDPTPAGRRFRVDTESTEP